MPTTCDIEFNNNPQKVLYAGQLLSGSVRLVLTEQKTVRGIYVRIIGKAYCHWTEGTGDNRKSYTGSEEYLNEKTYFVGGEHGELKIAPDTYNYTFQCMLPPELPTSVEGGIGYIRYMVRVVLDIPMWPDPEFEEPFTVIKAINLNAIPALREPAIADERKRFFFCFLLCCCSSDPLEIVARTPVGGYTPGQIINLQVNVNNQSDQPVSDFTVQLIKEITYFARSKQRAEKIVITEQDSSRGCDVNQSETIRVNIEVPPIPPTDFSTSNIVKVVYMIRVIGSVACCHSNPVLDLPITIGSYPIQDNVNAYPNAAMTTDVAMPTAPPDQSNYSTMPYPSAPFPIEDPPTYAEAMNTSDTSGNNFKPKYPIFKRATSYSSGD